MISSIQGVYDAEINFRISCFWDGGFAWKLGDQTNGWGDEGWGDTWDDAVRTLLEAANKLQDRHRAGVATP